MAEKPLQLRLANAAALTGLKYLPEMVYVDDVELLNCSTAACLEKQMKRQDELSQTVGTATNLLFPSFSIYSKN